MNINTLDTRVNALQKGRRRGRFFRGMRIVLLICFALALGGCALFDGMGDSDASADAGPTDAVTAGDAEDADTAPADTASEDSISEDAGDSSDAEDTADAVDESLGELAFSAGLEQMALWVGESSSLLNVEARDWDGELLTLQPGDLRWRVEPEALIALSDCTAQGCRITAVRSGVTTLYAEADGFRGTSLEIEGVGWQMVEADERVTCAINTRGTLYCWGVNTLGILGNGTQTGGEVLPQRVGQAHEPWRTVSLGSGFTNEVYGAACAVSVGGEIYCWGDNTTGRLGIGTTDSQFEPTHIASDSHEWAQVSVGSATTCAVTTSHEIYCWGRGSAGELGTDPIPTEFTENLAPNLAVAQIDGVPWSDVHVSYSSVYARTTAPANANLFAWGYSYLGAGSMELANTPIEIGNYHFVQVDAGRNHRCAIGGSGKVYCWGSNRQFRVINEPGCGNAPEYSICTPTEVPELTGAAIDLGVGPTHTCAVVAPDESGSAPHRIQCWGLNEYGQLGNGERPIELVVTYAAEGGVESEEDWSSVSAGVRHTCAITQAGKLFCWGELLTGFDNGQPSFQVKTQPTQVANPRL